MDKNNFLCSSQTLHKFLSFVTWESWWEEGRGGRGRRWWKEKEEGMGDAIREYLEDILFHSRVVVHICTTHQSCSSVLVTPPYRTNLRVATLYITIICILLNKGLITQVWGITTIDYDYDTFLTEKDNDFEIKRYNISFFRYSNMVMLWWVGAIHISMVKAIKES